MSHCGGLNVLVYAIKVRYCCSIPITGAAMIDPSTPPREEGRAASVPSSSWPHEEAHPPSLSMAAPNDWPETARAIVNRLDAGAALPVRPVPGRAIISLKGAEIVRAGWDQDCAALFAEAGVDTAGDAVVISCGGTDLIDALEGRPRAACLVRKRDATAAADALAAYVNRAALALLIGDVIGRFRQVISWSRARPGSVAPLVLHVSGCHPAATQSGVWLRPEFDAAGVPVALRRALTAYLYDKLAAGLGSLHDPSSQVHVVRWAGTSVTVLPMVAQLLARPDSGV